MDFFLDNFTKTGLAVIPGHNVRVLSFFNVLLSADLLLSKEKRNSGGEAKVDNYNRTQLQTLIVSHSRMF